MRDFFRPGRSAVFAESGMAATSHPLASQIAIETLKSGGNAVDAAIAAGCVLGLAEPPMTGIGGDCFFLVKPAGAQEVFTLNGSGRAPAAMDAQALRDQGETSVFLGSPHSVTIPGAIDAMCQLSKDWGKLSMADCLAPTIRYAEAGVPVAPRVARDWSVSTQNLTGFGRQYYLNQGAALGVGEVFRAPGQAEVLRRVVREGRAGFYEGEVAEDMVASLRALGGTHTLEDFAQTRCDYGTPISGAFAGVELLEHPPNGHGATAILMANILSHFDIPQMDPFGAERTHLEAEAAKLAYDTRNRFLADPDYMTRLDHMLSNDTARRLADLIHMDRVLPNPCAAAGAVHADTICLSVVDKDRMAVSMIYSIFKKFGSGIASEKFGVLFQNRGSGFTLEPGHPNEAGPRKRPMHTIIPAMVRESGEVTMSFGVMGGAYQPNGHIRFLSNIYEFGMDLQAAIDAPRSFAFLNETKVEPGYARGVQQTLADLGHNVTDPDEPIGGAQAVRLLDGGALLEGASDPRKDGCALGY